MTLKKFRTKNYISKIDIIKLVAGFSTKEPYLTKLKGFHKTDNIFVFHITHWYFHNKNYF